MSSNFKGLEKLQNNLKELGNKTEIKMTELMSPSFISDCSEFDSIESLFEASGFTVESPADFAAIPDEEWEEFIVINTSFNSWNEMRQKAMLKYAKQHLNKGL